MLFLRFVKKLQWIILTLALIMTVTELILAPSLDDRVMFQIYFLKQTTGSAKAEVTLLTMIGINVLTALLAQVRIEHDNLKSKDGSGTNIGFLPKVLAWIKTIKSDDGDASQSMTLTGYSLMFHRKLAGFALWILFLVIIHQTCGTKWLRLLMATSVDVILPLLFIYKHPKMKTLALKILGNCFPSCH